MRVGQGLLRVLASIELTWGEILAPVERQFAVAAQCPRDAHELPQMRPHASRQAVPVVVEHAGYVVNPRRFDPRVAQQRL